eukprot:Nitzschia sp. Nitz4//scaffold142_size57810//20997//23280//NITZ4_006494-RA/size57810-processed-gene-0.46-mRNA-1//1//CDS//3329536385//7427//frame0
MLALKKKREAEKKEKEEAAKREAASAVETPEVAPAATGGQVSLLGIGGQKTTRKGDAPAAKKTPGEIRIQKGATYHFLFTIPPHYPHSPPRVECETKIYHPNIDLQGKVCLNILREDWRPVLDINSVIYGLIYLFYEPNPDDPLNHEAADLFRKDVGQFERLVRRTLRGGILDGSTLYLHCTLSAPTFTMACSYFVMSAIHMVALRRRQNTEQQQQREFAHNTHQVLVIDQARYPFLFSTLTLQRPPWQYFVIALLDLEANAATLLAFRLTTLTSVSLLDAFSIPSAMVLSFCFLGRKYKSLHFVGVIVCLVGVLLNVLQDYSADHSVQEEQAYPHRFWGDMFAILGGIMYGLSDVIAEVTVRRNGDTTEYLAMMGFFAFILAMLQSVLFEWDDIQTYLYGPSTCSSGESWGILIGFVLVTVVGYMGGSKFLMISEAAFFNISLLTGDLWSIIFSVEEQKMVPNFQFFVALAIVVSGMILYEMAPHPVVQDPNEAAWESAQQQLAEIDQDFELDDIDEQNLDDYLKNDIDLDLGDVSEAKGGMGDIELL